MTATTSGSGATGAHPRAGSGSRPPAAATTPTPAEAGTGGWRGLARRLPREDLPGLATIGALVLLVALVVTDVTTPTTALAWAVVVAGVRTLVEARRGALPTGVVAAGLATAVVLTACWWAGAGLDAAPGWRTERPEAGLAHYEMAAGQLTVDLTEAPRPVGVAAEVGVGRVIVRVPDADVRAGRVDVRARVGGGWASVPVPRDDPIRPVGRDAGPALVDEVTTRPGPEPTVVVEVAVGVGSVEVQRVR